MAAVQKTKGVRQVLNFSSPKGRSLVDLGIRYRKVENEFFSKTFRGKFDEKMAKLPSFKIR
jgi:hypothetical protein